MKGIGCAILAGGRSSRLGQDKATMKVGEKMLIRHVYDTVAQIFDDIVIVSSRHTQIGGIDIPIVKDAVPFRGAMTGIISALLSSTNPYTFVVACDMPLVSVDVLKYIIGELGGQDIVIPKTRWGYEPLHAIYSRTCLPPMLRLIERGRFKIRDVLPFVSVKELNEEERFFRNGTLVFKNVNTTEDLALVAGA